MLNFTLFKRELRANYVVFLIFVGVLALYESMIVMMFDPQLGEMLDQFAKVMPQIMAAFGMVSVGSTLIEFVSSYLYGFLLLMFPMIFEIIVANRLVSRYVDRGSMACLLATPNKRSKIILTQATFMFLSLLSLIIISTAMTIAFSEMMFPSALDIPKFLVLNVNLLGLHFAISGICFFGSAVANSSKLSYSIGAGIPIAFYLIQMLANMGGKLEDLKYATIFSLFDPASILKEPGNLMPLFILCAIGIILYSSGILIFNKKDLSL
ncbi:MAG: hypothetical protein A2Y17_07975 [Clostridiales bacterium GWF2_38_85]|nr:MAG: hypothetical protein A2Y17_07975 [Clostridiales bacterium GWF2_38_85]HBL84186.1 hypothetical protein [Clostridiales bacterium]